MNKFATGLLRFTAAAGTLLLLNGCPSVASLTTAKPIGAGTHQFAVSPSVLGASLAVVGDSSASSGIGFLPVVDLGYRVGVTDNIDIGVGLKSWTNTMIDFKIALVQSDTFGLALDPAVGGFFFGGGGGSAGFLQYTIPVLIDLYFGDNTLTFGPKFQGLLIFASETTTGSSDSAHRALVGTTLGFDIAISPRFSVMPHGGFLYALDVPGDASAIFFDAGVAFKFTFGN